MARGLHEAPRPADDRMTVNKLKVIVPLVILVAVGVYKFALPEPGDKALKPRVAGEVYVLPREFLITMKGGRFAKLSIGLVLEQGFSSAPRTAGKGAPATPPLGFGSLPQEAAVRAIITEELTGSAVKTLATKAKRRRLKRRIANVIRRRTDVSVEDVLITDLVVQ